jgi:CO dehydrogenase maturation factor
MQLVCIIIIIDMKIAAVGKGGSGKSTVSWLLANYLANQGKNVLAIDADYNMDLISHFGLDSDNLNCVYDNHSLFREDFNMKHGEKWFDLLTQVSLPKFNLHSNIINKLSHKMRNTLSVMVTGLGDEDTLYTGKCGHSHSAPIKFLLPNLECGDNEYVIIDSVAGSDMLGYGLFMGCDMVVCVVEPLPNSIKVSLQIQKICSELDIECRFIINKSVQNDYFIDLQEKYEDSILGNISIDPMLISPSTLAISANTQIELKSIIESINSVGVKTENKWEKLKQFELQKDSMKAYFSTK